MRKTLNKILFLAVLIGLACCSKKTFPTCSLYSDLNKNSIDSEIITLDRLAIADTVSVYLHGNVGAKSIYENDTIVEHFEYINVWVKDLNNNSKLGTTTDENGDFELTIPPSKYDLEFQFVGYNNLKVKNIIFGSGDIVKFEVILGQGMFKTEYDFISYDLVKKSD